MFEKIKKALSDFFYKDVDEDEHQQEVTKRIPQEKETKKDLSAPRVLSKMDNQTRQVAYKYPKNNKTRQFKFPLMEDDKTPVKRKKKSSKLVRDKHERKQVSNKPEEEIPTFKRKTRKSAVIEQEVEKEPVPEVTSEIKIEKQEIPPYTRPEELDRVFSKRDGKLIKTEIENNIIKPSEAKEEFEIEKKQASIQPSILKSNLHEEKIIVEKEAAEQLETEFERNTPEQVDNIVNEVDESETVEVKKVGSRFETTERDVKPSVTTIKSEVQAASVPHHLLDDEIVTAETDDDWLIEQQILLEDAFTQFNIEATVVDVKQGPAITQFEIRPSKGVKVSKIRNLSDDLKLHLSAKEIRIEAPIPGKNTIGIEVPNLNAKTVYLQQLIESNQFTNEKSPLTIALGLTIDGEPLITNIHKMPHGLIAGATGSGKSVCINTIILSILYKASHEDVKLLLIDPKMVELTPYNQIPHLITPVITDVKAATKSLKWAVQEMEERYHRFVELGVRNIDKYNEKIKTIGDESYEKMPYIVIIIDELADLMMMSPQEVEDAICRIAQKARACGIHLLLATQRPSVDVITGLIKANIPTRIAFSVSSQVDSRTMLDQSGAEKLLGKGDMLFLENGAKTVRLQGPFVSDEEIERVTDYVKQIAAPNYLFEEEQLMLIDEESDEDDLMKDVLDFVSTEQQASTSLLQRRFRIGYNRAARLIDSLEEKGVITGQNGSKPREVLVTKDQIDTGY